MSANSRTRRLRHLPSALGRGWLSALLALLALMLAACSSLPVVDRKLTVSEAIPLSAETSLGRMASAFLPDPLHSGFRLLPLGSHALDTRLELAHRAEVSLDLPYCQFEHDGTGRWLLRALRDAAQRGVRVRLLIDD